MEILVVEIKICDIPVRLITGYGPQESAGLDKRLSFYSRLDEEIASAQESGCGVLIELDCNAKLGDQIIKGFQHKMSEITTGSNRALCETKFFAKHNYCNIQRNIQIVSDREGERLWSSRLTTI